MADNTAYGNGQRQTANGGMTTDNNGNNFYLPNNNVAGVPNSNGMSGGAYGGGGGGGAGATGQGGLAGALGTVSGFNATDAPGSAYSWNGPGVGGQMDLAQQAREGYNQKTPQLNESGVNQYLSAGQDQQKDMSALAQALNAQANGTGGPSAADLQLQKGADASMDQSLALARSAQGPGASTSTYNAQQQGAKTMATTNQDAGVLRAQESAQARQQLQGLYNQQLAGNMQAASLQQGMATSNAQLQAQQNQLNSQTALGYNQGAIQAGQAQLQGGIAQGSNDLGVQAINAGTSQYNAGANAQMIGAAASAVGSMASGAAMSDVHTKTAIKPGHNVSDSFLDALSRSESTFKYKDPSNEPTSHPTGDRYLGVMAQSLQDTPTGDTLVKQGPRGLMLDLAPNLSAALAGLGRLNERLEALEGKKK